MSRLRERGETGEQDPFRYRRDRLARALFGVRDTFDMYLKKSQHFQALSDLNETAITCLGAG
jgi:hypothetical protein